MSRPQIQKQITNIGFIYIFSEIYTGCEKTVSLLLFPCSQIQNTEETLA